MRPSRAVWIGFAAVAMGSGLGARSASAQGTPGSNPPVTLDPLPPPADANPVQSVRPLTEGPLHEAFLSKAKDRDPLRVAKAPPEPVVERPAVDPPSEKAQWIEGYWDWDPARNDHVWVTGTWRVPPPGRIWINGYWKRDDQGWYRVGGFWSDRKTDRIDYRKTGPPPNAPTRRSASRPAPTTSTSRGSMLRTETGWPGGRASGPRSRRAGRGSPPSG